MTNDDDAFLTPLSLSERMLASDDVRGDSPIEYDSTPVKIRGEEIGKVMWRGRQWAVTDFGSECLDGTYYIAKDRLTELWADRGAYGWPIHVTPKTWVDTDDFCTAWLVALSLHGCKTEVSAVLAAIAQSHPPR